MRSLSSDPLSPHPATRLAAALIALVAGAAVLAPVTAAADPAAAARGAGSTGGDGNGRLRAEITRTEHGVPHIVADDYASLGYGYGYAFAQDNLCTAADFYTTVRGERSQHFGPDGSWTFHGNGTTHNNLASDAYHRAVNASGRIEELMAQEPPHGPLPEVREAVRGYVAGYNAHLDDIGGADGVDDPRCAGEDWVQPISELDAYRRFYQLATMASAGVAIGGIGDASPPTPDPGAGGGDGAPALPDAEALAPLTDLLDDGPMPVEGPGALPEVPGVSDEQRELVAQLPDRLSTSLGIGSNAYGLGSEVTDSGAGMVLGNPHFPWQGGERLYQAHLTIPGRLDVQGASLLGVPVILIGTTEGLAWSHTVSTAYRFTPFQLTLVPGSPTTYLVDGEPKEMERREVTVPLDDGGEEQRTLYWTEHGPVITEVLGLPLFPWAPTTAFAMGDANDHLRYLNHFFAKNHAQDVDELAELTDRYQGVPWVNTIAADAEGQAYYADVSVVPHVTDEHVARCPTGLGIVTFAALGLPVLDGARSDCDWGSDDDAVADGILGPSSLPRLVRDDYVHNGNDSHWLSNPAEPLEGYPRIVGDERTARTMRTRVGLRMVEDRLAGADGHGAADPSAGDRFSLPTLQAAALDNRQHAAELLLDDLLAWCETLPATLSTSGPPVSTDGACEALADWDRRDDLDSKGAILFRRFVANLQSLASPVGDPTGTGLLDLPWAELFDPEDPVNTPRGLNTVDPRVSLALGDAIADLDGAGIPLDAPLGDWQYVERGEQRIPIHGGPGGVGVFNAINVDWQGDPEAGPTGYPTVEHGTSFIMTATWSDEPGECPVQAEAFVTYGQSEDPTSPYRADQTQRFSDKDWVPMRFCRDDVARHAIDRATVTGTLSGEEPGRDTDDRDDPSERRSLTTPVAGDGGEEVASARPGGAPSATAEPTQAAGSEGRIARTGGAGGLLAAWLLAGGALLWRRARVAPE